LDWFVTGFSERSGIIVKKEIMEPGRPLSQELNTALFRIIQEALANIHKHAECKEATIYLFADGDQVILEIGDKGKGINLARLEGRRDGVRGLGVGLTGMRERVRQLGGTLWITSANPGTWIKAIFPMNTGNGQ